MRKIQPNSIIFSALISLVILGDGCASRPVVTTFDAKWEFVERAGPPVKACLAEDDVAKLRELLIRCKAAQQ